MKNQSKLAPIGLKEFKRMIGQYQTLAQERSFRGDGLGGNFLAEIFFHQNEQEYPTVNHLSLGIHNLAN